MVLYKFALSGEIPACQRGYPLFSLPRSHAEGCDGRDWRKFWSESLMISIPVFEIARYPPLTIRLMCRLYDISYPKRMAKQILLNHPVGCDFDMVDHTRRLAIEFIDPSSSSSGEFDNMRLMYKTLLALHHGYRIMHVYLKHLGLIN